MNELIANDRMLIAQNKHLLKKSKKKNKSSKLKVSKKNKKYLLNLHEGGFIDGLNPMGIISEVVKNANGYIDLINPVKKAAEFVTGKDLSPFGLIKNNLFGSSKGSQKAVCDTVPLISGQNIELKSDNDTVLGSMYRKIFGDKPSVNPDLSKLTNEQKSTADGVVATFLKPALTGILASGGYVVNNPVASASIGALALKLASDPKLSEPILNLMNDAKNGFKTASGSVLNEADNLLTNGLQKVGNLGAQSYMGFKNYLDNLNMDSVPTGPIDSVILGKYKNDITKAYKLLQGYDKERDKNILDQEREIINSGYKQFAELQWLAAVTDIETEIHKPKYDKEEDNEFKKKLYIKMVAAFCNKTSQLGLNNFEISFKNDIIFSHDPCDFKLFEHLGELLQMVQYNMLFSVDNLSSRSILEISNLPMKVFSYKLWYICCIHTNYNPYNEIQNAKLWKILPTFVMEHLDFFSDFHKIIDSQKVDETITEMVKNCGYAVDLDKKNPIIAGLRKKEFFGPVKTATEGFKLQNEKDLARKASKSVMKFVFETANVVINYIVQLKLNDWNLIVTLCYCLKCSIYIYMFVFFRMQQLQDKDKSLSKTDWLYIIQEHKSGFLADRGDKIDLTTYIKFCKQLLWLSRINQVLEQEGVRVTENYDIELKKDTLGGNRLRKNKITNNKLSKNNHKGGAQAVGLPFGMDNVPMGYPVQIGELVQVDPNIVNPNPQMNIAQDTVQHDDKSVKEMKHDDKLVKEKKGGNDADANDFIFGSSIDIYNKNSYDKISIYEPVSIGEYCIIFPENGKLINSQYTSELIKKIYELLKVDSGYEYVISDLKKYFSGDFGNTIDQLSLQIDTAKKQVLDGIETLKSIRTTEYGNSGGTGSLTSIITNLVSSFQNILNPLKDMSKIIQDFLVNNLKGQEKIIEDNNYADQLIIFITKFSDQISILSSPQTNSEERKKIIENINENKSNIIAKISSFEKYLDVASKSLNQSREELENQGSDNYTQQSNLMAFDEIEKNIAEQKKNLEDLRKVIEPFDDEYLEKLQNKQIFSLLQANNNYKNLIDERNKMFRKSVDFGKIYQTNNQQNLGLPIADSYVVLVWLEDGTVTEKTISKDRISILYPNNMNNKKNFYQEYIWIAKSVKQKGDESGGEIKKLLSKDNIDPTSLDKVNEKFLEFSPELERLKDDKIIQQNIDYLQKVKSYGTADKIRLDFSASDYLKALNGVTTKDGKMTKGAVNFYKYTQLVNSESFNPDKYWYYQYTGNNDVYKLKFKIDQSSSPSNEDVIYNIVKANEDSSNDLIYVLKKCDTLVFLKDDESEENSIPNKNKIFEMKCHGIISFAETQDERNKKNNIKAIHKSGDLPTKNLLYQTDELIDEEQFEQLIKNIEPCVFGSENTGFDFSSFFQLFKTNYETDSKSGSFDNIIDSLKTYVNKIYGQGGGGPAESDANDPDIDVNETLSETKIKKNQCSDEYLLQLPVKLISSIISRGLPVAKDIVDQVTNMLGKILNFTFGTASVFAIAISGEIAALLKLVGLGDITNTWTKITDSIREKKGFLAGIISFIVSLITTIIKKIGTGFKSVIEYFKLKSSSLEDKENKGASTNYSSALNIEAQEGGYQNNYGKELVQIQVWQSLLLLSVFMNKFLASKKKVEQLSNQQQQTNEDNESNLLYNNDIQANKRLENEYMEYIQYIYKLILDKRQKIKQNIDVPDAKYTLNSDAEQDENESVLNFTKSEEINQQIQILEDKIDSLRQENMELQYQISSDEKELKTNTKLTEEQKTEITGRIETNKAKIIKNENFIKSNHSKILENQSKMNQPLFENYIRGSKADRQLYAARNIDPLIQSGFMDLNQSNNTNGFNINNIKQSLKVTVPNQIFESSSHLDRVRSFSSDLLRNNSVPRGRKPYTIMFSMVMMASQNRKKNQNLKNVDFQNEYNNTDKIEILEQQESRGFRSFQWSFIANNIGLLQGAGGIVKNLQSEALNQVLGVGLGQTGIAKAINKFVIDKMSNVANNAINLSRSNYYFPVLENVFGQIEKISSNEYLIRIINENNIFFADFDNTITKPIIKVTLIGNQAIYRYVTVNLNTQNPAMKKKQEGMQVYYIGNENNVRLPYEPNNVDVDYLECEILFYPLRLADLVKKSNEYKYFDPRIWTPIFDQIVGNFDPSFEDLQMKSLGSQVLENVNLNILQILSKPSINTIKDNRDSLNGKVSKKNLVRKMDLLNKLILESIYSYHTGNIFGEILLFLTYNIQNCSISNDKDPKLDEYSRVNYNSFSSLLLCSKSHEDEGLDEIIMLKGNCLIISRVKKNKTSTYLRDVAGSNQKSTDKEIKRLLDDVPILKNLNESGVLYIYFKFRDYFKISLSSKTGQPKDFLEQIYQEAKKKTLEFFCIIENTDTKSEDKYIIDDNVKFTQNEEKKNIPVKPQGATGNDEQLKLQTIKKLAYLVSNSSVQKYIFSKIKEFNSIDKLEDQLNNYKVKIIENSNQDSETFIIDAQNKLFSEPQQLGGAWYDLFFPKTTAKKKAEEQKMIQDEQDKIEKEYRDRKFEKLGSGPPVKMYKLGPDDEINNSEPIYRIYWVQFPQKDTKDGVQIDITDHIKGSEKSKQKNNKEMKMIWNSNVQFKNGYTSLKEDLPVDQKNGSKYAIVLIMDDNNLTERGNSGNIDKDGNWVRVKNEKLNPIVIYLNDEDFMFSSKKDSSQPEIWSKRIELIRKNNSKYMLYNYLDKISKLDKRPEGVFNL